MKTSAQRIRRGAQLLVLSVLCLVGAAGGQSANRQDELRALETSIRSRLEQHGERVLGKDAYRWSTRLDSLEGCRVTLVETVTNNVGEQVVRHNEVSVPLGKIGETSIEPEKVRLVLSCSAHDPCVFTHSTCTKTTKQGITVDCSSPGEKRQEALRLQLDGSEAAALELERDFRRAVELCHAPLTTTF
jgi:hypothetical protein